MNVFDNKSGNKHIFIFSAAGKPIFSRLVISAINLCLFQSIFCSYDRQGDEQDLVTVFGLLQAVASIVHDSGDILRCINAGPTKILYLFRRSLYFVAVSSNMESEAALYAQLDFLYNQILFILTGKV